MFSNLKEKIQQVQDGISASIRNLKIREDKTKSELVNVNFDAGVEILLQNENNMNEIHSISEENYHKAEIIDQKIARVNAKLEERLRNLQVITNFISCIPKFVEKIEAITNDLNSLQIMILEAEEFLVKFEDLIEIEEMKQKEVNERFQLAAYTEKKSSEIEILKQKLTEQYSEKVLQKEKKTQEKLKERQELFNMAFQQDMQFYKESGIVPNIRTRDSSSGISLEDVIIEDDMKSLNELLEN